MSALLRGLSWFLGIGGAIGGFLASKEDGAAWLALIPSAVGALITLRFMATVLDCALYAARAAHLQIVGVEPTEQVEASSVAGESA